MRKRGLSAAALGRRTGTTHAGICHYLNGGNPSASMLIKLADVFAVSPYWLFTGREQGCAIHVSDFTERTDSLAHKHSLKLEQLAKRIGISRAMFFAYRSGAQRPTAKALLKLEQFEGEAAQQPPSFAQRLRAVMQAKGFNQTTLAIKVRVAQSRVSQWCAGIAKPQARVLTDLAQALQVSAQWLINGAEQEQRAKAPPTATAAPEPDLATACAHDFYPA